jgi:hypothetical protein
MTPSPFPFLTDGKENRVPRREIWTLQTLVLTFLSLFCISFNDRYCRHWWMKMQWVWSLGCFADWEIPDHKLKLLDRAWLGYFGRWEERVVTVRENSPPPLVLRVWERKLLTMIELGYGVREMRLSVCGGWRLERNVEEFFFFCSFE